VSQLTTSDAWQGLLAQAARLRAQAIEQLFEIDPARSASCRCEAAGLALDYAKQLIDPQAVTALLALAEQQQLDSWIRRMFRGDIVNCTEHRAALHVALRSDRAAPVYVDGSDVMPMIRDVQQRVDAFAESVRSLQVRGATGLPFRTVVNIGIGGSDLGPRMVCETLAPQIDGPRPLFVSNVDGAQIDAVLRDLDPASTLFVVTSKMFTTQETLANAHTARAWLATALGEAAVPHHFVAVSTNRDEVAKFGIDPQRMFEFWDWVGGRYSLWSAVGLPIALALGPARFRELREGARAMDDHFRTAPAAQNLPVLLGLLAVWNASFLGTASQVVAPYAQRLERFVAWLQQLEMESNGKRVDRDGNVVDYATTPALWGDVGTNAQHAFFQMLHQSPAVHAVDFIVPITADHPYHQQHRILLANCLAQSAALMHGKTEAEVRRELQARGMSAEAVAAAAPHRVFPGNRPSNTLLLPKLDAYYLGALLATYEHRTFVQAVLWNINPFDQWGVELGKQIAREVLGALDSGEMPANSTFDPSTQALIAHIRAVSVAVPDAG